MIGRLLPRIPAVRRYGDRRYAEGEVEGYGAGSTAGYRLGRNDGLSEGFDRGLLAGTSDSIEIAAREARKRREAEGR